MNAEGPRLPQAVHSPPSLHGDGLSVSFPVRSAIQVNIQI